LDKETKFDEKILLANKIVQIQNERRLDNSINSSRNYGYETKHTHNYDASYHSSNESQNKKTSSSPLMWSREQKL